MSDEAPICGYCGARSVLRDSAVIYGGVSYGPVYICGNYPTCNAYVGTHRGTTKPLGSLANGELRWLRKVCHAAFDPIWRTGRMKRKEAYRWMREALELDEDEAHIAMFDEVKCRRLLAIIDGRSI